MRRIPLLALGLVHCAEPGSTPSTDSPAPSCEAQPVATAIDTGVDTVNGSPFLYARSEDPRGLAFLFHGGHGDKEDFSANRVEAVLITQGLLDAGYTIAALDSVAHLDAGSRHTQWNEDETAANPDVVNVIAMRDRLTDPADLNAAPDTPPLVIGMSNGGSMASRVVQHIDVHAAAIYISNAQAFWNDDARFAPMLLMPGENDPGHALASNADLAQIVEASGTPVTYLPNTAEPVTAGRFTRIPGVDCEDSMAIRASLIEIGLLGDDGEVLDDPDEVSWHEAVEPYDAEVTSGVSDVLTEAFAGHSPSADMNADLLAFLDGLGT